ncbi:uncharacterized protein I303_102245 [Kwoniella dejecticola CBS 10117]|uniref:Uncharacterized protein n=1 Tax=Kwoniella dejecticola CBS 10117 TaxID=1296121 RepID=A0A1A6ABI7_9TREE|nr:uncharacterized protein I303_01616 [Kwoniella dejecticola CBS 10117]OBR87414.1 hypothetical protein I303_01616 [Kwoniella dejecticola CBS 10117]
MSHSTEMSGGADASNAGGSYQVDLDTILWSSLASTPDRTTWWSVFALVIQSLIISSIITKTFQYFEYFQKTDNPVSLGFIGLGCFAAIGSLALTCSETYQLIYHAPTDFHTIFRFLFIGDQTILLLGSIFNLSAGIYYSWRVWRMLNSRSWVIPVCVIGLLLPFSSALATVIKGYKIPTIEMQNLEKLPGFFDDYVYTSRVWGGLTLAVDAALCLCLTILLLRSKDSVFHNESRLLHKLFALMYESMLPPVILLVILESADNVAGSPTTDWRKLLVTCIPNLYFHSVLSALVSRQTIRGLLDSKLRAEGGVSLLSSGYTSNSSGVKRLSRSFPSTVHTTSRKTEEGVSGYEMKSDFGSQVSVGGPMIKVRVEQNEAISEPDNYAMNHPHLSPIEGTSTVNRDHSNRIRPPIEGLEDVPYGFSVNRPWRNPSEGVN